MLSLQEWIHKFEEGEGVHYVKLGVAMLGLLGLAALYDIREFKNFSTQEAMDSAQLARNLAEGRGYTTQFIRPVSVLLLQRQADPGIPVLKREHHPDLENPPVYPGMLAGLMRVLPFQWDVKTPFNMYQPEVLIALFNQLLFFAAIVLVFRIAKRLFDAPVAWMSAIVFAGAELYWRFSVSGLSTMLLVFLFLAIAWCLVSLEHHQREAKRGQWWFLSMAVLAGILIGIGGLTRYSFGWLIVPVAGFLALFFAGRRFALAGVAVAACVIVMAPWVARNYLLSRTPFGTAGYAIYQETEPFSGNRMERFLGAEFYAEMAKVGPTAFARKLVTNGTDICKNDLPRLGGSWITAFFVVSLLVPFRSVALNRLRIFLLLCLGTLVVVQALGRTHLSMDSREINSENLLALMAPLTFVYGAGLFFVLLDQIEVSFPPLRTLIVIGFELLICLPLVLTLLPPRSSAPAWPPYWPPRVQQLSRWLRPTELMMSDMPWAVAWYGDRKSIWITLDAPSDTWHNATSDFYSIYDSQKLISALYLTSITTDAQFGAQVMRSPNWVWGRFVLESQMNKSVPNGFPLKYSMPGFLDDGQLFLADRVRWPRLQ